MMEMVKHYLMPYSEVQYLMNNYIVYKHTSPSGKIYIGITSQLPNRRWRNGKGYKEHTYFWNAIQKYGWDNIKHEILYRNLSKEEAESKEIELIALFDSNNIAHGYNMSLGGESGSYGYRFSKEQRDKMSIRTKGENNPMFGKNHTEETKQRLRILHSKESLSQDTIDKMSKAKKGKKRTYESIEKQRKTISNIVICIETMQEYIGTREAGKCMNIDPSCIAKVCRGERKTAGGFHWMYKGGD